mmetsp:Transcript_62896/g.73184  ORF Transcript_62896/g.73184 Transcript_62896/m.73184 type:complete len:161 (+) Transcript_62896:65-547(+)
MSEVPVTRNSGGDITSIVDRMKGNTTAATSSASPADVLPPLRQSFPSHHSAAATGKTAGSASTSASVNEALLKAIRMNEQTNEVGLGALSSLGKQSETIQRSLSTVDETHMNLRDSRRSLRMMKLQYWKDRVGKALVILCLLGVIGIIVYVKWIRRLSSS